MEPLSLTTLGGELRTRRSARGLSRATLAQAVGTRPVIIGRWERGEAIPTPEQVLVLVEVLDLPPSLTGDWAAAERVGLAIGPAGPLAPARAAARGEWWLPRRRSLARLTAPADERPASAPPVGAHPSYLDDPAEQRRYALRWAFTLVILGALAILLIWSLGELTDGWRALIELFRTGPTTGDGTSACGLVGVV
jgi:transcriptional regulator with XRE-family HTH domain